jgi:hypothetical protein
VDQVGQKAVVPLPSDESDINAYLGDKSRAFPYLERSYVERSYWMTTLRVHPVVNSLRADPRFAAMMRRMNLE